MTKRILFILGLFVFGLVVVEVVGLLQMKASLSGYARYWRTRPQAGEFVYVALGDSAAQGIGASHPERGYVGLLAKHIEQSTGRKVRIVNLSVSGAKIADVTAKQLPQLNAYNPDLVTIEIGGNDVVRFDAVAFARQYDELAQALPGEAVISNVPFFGGRIRRGGEVNAANQIIARAADKYKLQLADLYKQTASDKSPFNNSFDLFHPSNRGYRNWEQAFWQVIEPGLKASEANRESGA